MDAQNCLNCSNIVTENFCKYCGQRTDLHRITVKHFIVHDLLHGVWHLERGILFTLKQALLRPGKAALEYIGGKRIRYYNVFYLSLLVIALNVLINHFYDSILYDDPGKSAEQNSEFFKFLSQNLKFILLGIVPIIAVNGLFVFRRLRLNLAEHFIIGGMSLLGILICSIPFFFATFMEQFYSARVGIFKIVFVIPMLFYPVYTYHNAARHLYTLPGFLWRSSAFLFLIFIQIIIIVMALVTIITGESDLIINV